APDPTVQMSEDGGKVGGAEAGSDGVEVGSGGALADGVDEVAAVDEEDADGVEEVLDVGGALLLWWIWRKGGWCVWFHADGITNGIWLGRQGKYSGNDTVGDVAEALVEKTWVAGLRRP
ncbi:MAG TPA: hypothetical protein VKQ27_17620, partial [Acetobacteraceae bacterium]|nr:hypothetical protein [Acetobacteraceae bacterium]